MSNLIFPTVARSVSGRSGKAESFLLVWAGGMIERSHSRTNTKTAYCFTMLISGSKTMRVLILEDDVALGPFLAKGLAFEKLKVEIERSGRSGLEALLLHPPDLLVLDLGLPEMDGLEVLERMQGRCPHTSVLVLTGRTGVQDRVQCLNLGADDCLAKPFSFNEFTARCRALLRRRQKPSAAVLRVGELELDRIQRTVMRKGHFVELTTKEFSLLEYLVLARGRTCLRSELLCHVWNSAPPAGTNVVDVYINYLRKKLSQSADRSCIESDDRIIETVRGEGYAIFDASKGLQETDPTTVHFPQSGTNLLTYDRHQSTANVHAQCLG